MIVWNALHVNDLNNSSDFLESSDRNARMGSEFEWRVLNYIAIRTLSQTFVSLQTRVDRFDLHWTDVDFERRDSPPSDFVVVPFREETGGSNRRLLAMISSSLQLARRKRFSAEWVLSSSSSSQNRYSNRRYQALERDEELAPKISTNRSKDRTFDVNDCLVFVVVFSEFSRRKSPELEYIYSRNTCFAKREMRLILHLQHRRAMKTKE